MPTKVMTANMLNRSRLTPEIASTPAVHVSASAVGTRASSVKSQRRNAATSSTSTISDPAEMPLANSGVKRSAISRLTAGSPDSRAVPPDAATARRTPSTAAGEAG